MIHNASLANFNDINSALAREHKFHIQLNRFGRSGFQVDNLNLKHHRSLE